MKLFIPLLFIVTSCAALPQLFQSVENIADDDAVKVTVSKEAIASKKDLKVALTLQADDQK
jgi:hypothetical protein